MGSRLPAPCAPALTSRIGPFMFESLSARLQGITERLRGKARITEADLDVALREIRLALLEADVNFKVVKDFVARVRERAIGADLLTGLNPGQQIVKIVHDELVGVLGGERQQLRPRREAVRPDDGRPPGLGKDDDRRQAGGPPAQGRQASRCSWRPTCTARPRSTSSCSSATRSASRSTPGRSARLRSRSPAPASRRPASAAST